MANLKNAFEKFNSIRWKLSLLFLLGVAIVLVLMGFAFENTFLRYFVDKELDENLRRVVLIDKELNPSDSIQQVSEKTQRITRFFDYTITIYPIHNPNDRASNPLQETTYKENLKDSLGNLRDPVVLDQYRTEGIRFPVKLRVHNEQGMLLGFVEISENKPSVLHNELIALFLRIGLIALLCAGIIGFLISTRLTKPIRDMTHVVQLISDGEFKHKVHVVGRDEIGQLGHQFNRMTSQLESSFNLIENERDKLKRIIADLSHEIKTPITALRSFNELLINGADDDKEIRMEFLNSSREQIDRLRHFTDNLLAWSRLDAGVEMQEQQISEIKIPLNRSITRLRPLAIEKGIRLFDSISAKPALVMMNERQIEQIFDNLISNAIKFTPKEGSITVTLEVDIISKEVNITIEDTGAGIDRNDIPYVFERFYRGRVQPKESSQGSGLGLAIVKSILDIHGGKITLLSERHKGTSFFLTFPLADAKKEK